MFPYDVGNMRCQSVVSVNSRYGFFISTLLGRSVGRHCLSLSPFRYSFICDRVVRCFGLLVDGVTRVEMSKWVNLIEKSVETSLTTLSTFFGHCLEIFDFNVVVFRLFTAFNGLSVQMGSYSTKGLAICANEKD